MAIRARRWLWAAAIVAVLLVLLKALVFGLYHVDTASMEPTIQGSQGGERVLVLYGGSAPRRFDLVVALRAGEETPLVKRAAALPGEHVQVVDGDLLIEGKRLPPEAPRPRPIPVFDERWQDPEHGFRATAEGGAAWQRLNGEWRLDARASGASGELALVSDVRDSYLDAQHALVTGETSVNDLALECELQTGAAGTRAHLGLSEQGDRFELELEVQAGGKLGARMVRRGVETAELGACELALGAGTWHRVRFSNLDNALCFELDGTRRLVASYAQNRLAPEDRLQEGRNYLPRAWLGGAAGALAVRGLRLERDLYYTPRGGFATQGALSLGPDEYFLLGDNSASSRDGREWGPTLERELVGRPLWIVWPLSHARALEGAVPPPALAR